MALTEPADPLMNVECHSCGWYGKVMYCDPQINNIVVCPKCGEAVSRVVADDSFIVEK